MYGRNNSLTEYEFYGPPDAQDHMATRARDPKVYIVFGIDHYCGFRNSP